MLTADGAREPDEPPVSPVGDDGALQHPDGASHFLRDRPLPGRRFLGSRTGVPFACKFLWSK